MVGAQALKLAGENGPSREIGTYPAVRREIELEIRSSLPTVSSCQSAADLRAWLLKFARGLGFYGARYVHIGRRWWTHDRADTPVRFLTTSDRKEDQEEDWLARDPNVERVRTAFAPFAWSTRARENPTELQRMWLERERACGVAAGVAVPVQDSADGPAYLSLFGYDESAVQCLIAEHAPELAFLAAQFHALAKQLVKVESWAPELSVREIECLRLAAHGWTIRESGDILGVSKRTVEYHLQKAMITLGAETKIRAVVIAFGSGLAQV
ncbi:LuxR family transcriptional regulator [Sphingomonas sp. QA11]|uniref:helix-turn-helix transcriptional regulator n=1 Tax=Sphingomonas sp. QA11 TaxID=2950605 RepID=UPI00234A6637|nr:LuxR family transcriptional regulator [Sphingomonas sp. QA11]WCM29725.1 LuxR family transcriptional regulator [Sphingomonas sp. QA11]